MGVTLQQNLAPGLTGALPLMWQRCRLPPQQQPQQQPQLLRLLLQQQS